METWLNKSFISVLNNNIILAQLCVVVLFFECFTIYFDGKSLLNISLDFKSLNLKPFIAFIYFIVITKIIWFIIVSIKNRFQKPKKDLPSVSYEISYLIFLLGILNLFYINLIEANSNLLPITENNFLFLLIFFSLLLVVIISFSMLYHFNIEFNEKKEENKSESKLPTPRP